MAPIFTTNPSKSLLIVQYTPDDQLGETKCEDLGDCADEVNLKLSLWQGSAEFEQLTSTWNDTHFESLDVASMEETTVRCVAFP